jgi:hypothetical protein
MGCRKIIALLQLFKIYDLFSGTPGSFREMLIPFYPRYSSGISHPTTGYRELRSYRVCIIAPTARYSDGPLFRRPIIPTTHYSDSPLLRRPIFRQCKIELNPQIHGLTRCIQQDGPSVSYIRPSSISNSPRFHAYCYFPLFCLSHASPGSQFFSSLLFSGSFVQCAQLYLQFLTFPITGRSITIALSGNVQPRIKAG